MSRTDWQLEVDPVNLTCEPTGDGDFALTLGGDVVRDPIGHRDVIHSNRELIDLMRGEFRAHPLMEVDENREIQDPAFIGAYRLWGLQREWVDGRRDNLTEDFTRSMVEDPFWRRLPGPEAEDQKPRWQPATEWLERRGLKHVDIDLVSLPDYRAEMYETSEESTDAFFEARDDLQELFLSLDAEERTCVVYLHNALQGCLVHALALVTGNCTELEFADGVSAAHAMFFAMPDIDASDHREIYPELAANARAALAYIDAYRAGGATARLLSVLAGQESGTVEFKSTLRFDLREQRKNKALTDVVVKTVAGFLNTKGGTLLIGVSDDNDLIGIEADGFKNTDAFVRHLYTSLTNAMGPAVTPLVTTTIAQHRGKSVAIVECQRGSTPFTVRKSDGTETFYARTGPATIALADDEKKAWLLTHWR